jgi:nickel-dependent lactate racemase
MQIGLEYGRTRLELEIPQGKLVQSHRQPLAPPLADPAKAVRTALESPIGFPALRRALTPDDHVVIVLDEQLPSLPQLLVPVLEHVVGAQVAPAAITVLCMPTTRSQSWVEELPESLQEVRIEVHDPADRRRLSYLATTRRGRRIYLNRTAVDADQLIVLTRRGFDPLLGYSGAEGALYPALSDEATRQELNNSLSLEAPGGKPWPIRQEAAEVAWLLGAPFMVQLIEGAGDTVSHVLAGLADTGEDALRLLNTRWRVSVDQPADVVVASVTGDASRHTFAELAQALACAARVVQPQGKIVLLSQARPALGEAAELLRQADDPALGLQLLREHKGIDRTAAFQWASAARRANLYLLSELPSETAEELFVTPLEHAGQVQRLLSSAGSCLIVADAHKTLAIVENTIS